MSRAFVSYSHADHELAAQVAQQLRDAGVVVWMDGDTLHAGDEWRVQIDDGLACADAVIVLLSAAADASKYVTYEWSYAFASGAALILLHLDNTEGHPRLSHLQHLDFSDPAARDWERLIADVKRSSNARLAAKLADAEAAAALAIEGFTELLAERYEHMTGAWPGNARPLAARPDERSVNAFGKSLVQVPSLDVDAAVTELRQLLAQAAAWRREREAANGAVMEQLYRQAWESMPGLNQYLAAIAVHGKSMEATWRRAIYAGEELLREILPRVAIFETYRLTELRQFIEQHAAWPVLRAELGASLDALTARGSLAIADLVAALAERMRAAVHADLLTAASA